MGSRACGECHRLNHAGWQETLHAKMARPATPQTVRADFDVRNEYWLHDGVHSRPVPPEEDRVLVRMVRDGDAYYAYVYDPEDDRLEPYRITHVLGEAYRQTFLVQSGDTFFRVPVQWAIQQRRWVNLWRRQARQDETVEGPMEFFLNDHARWNEVCARCHTTGYRLEGGGQWSELAIACEACHGAGGRHAALFRPSKLERLRASLRHGLGLPRATAIVRPDRLDPARAVSICAQCHHPDIWLKHVPKFVAFEPGEDLSEHFREVPLEPEVELPPSNKTWPDASPRGPGMLFRSFVESRCFREGGVTCHDCHDPHAPREYRELLAAGPASDAYCLRCHEQIGRDPSAHTRHPQESEGSRCYACHMPRLLEGIELVGQFDYNRIRTHELDHIPYPEATVRFGGPSRQPNACADCHADRDAAWAVAWARRWWGPRERVAREIEARLRAAEAERPRGERTFGL